MTRHNVKTRKGVYETPTPGIASREERNRAKRRGKKNGQGGKAESFPAVERQKKRMDEECRSTRERESEKAL